MLILFPATLLNSFINSNFVCVYVKSLGFFAHKTILSMNRRNFISSFPIWASILCLAYLLWVGLPALCWTEATKAGTGIPHFWKVRFMPLCFYDRPTLVSVFANQKKSEEFCFYKRKVKSKNSIQCWFCSELLQRQHAPWAVRVALPSPFPGNYTQHQAVITLNCVCEHLCFISIYFVIPLARCVLR